MNLLKNAAEFLARQRKSYVAEPVEYRRLGGGIFSVSASVGKTLFRSDDVTGIVIRTLSFDFLILASDLGAEPEKGDEIIYQNGKYEVLAPNNESVWRWSGNNQDTYRIHTNFVGVENDESDSDKGKSDGK